MIKKPILFLLFCSFCINCNLRAQEQDTVKLTPYDLMSSYYHENFHPFKKNNWYMGLAFSLKEKRNENTPGLLQTIVDGDNLDYNLVFKTGYHYHDYTMAGLNFHYYQRKFTGTVFQDPDTIQKNDITRGYGFTPYVRYSLPLTQNERLSFFVQLELGVGWENTTSRNIRNIDEVTKQYATTYNMGVGVTPGVTFFAMQDFAVEIALNVLGYNLEVTDTEKDGYETSRKVKQNVNFSLNILTLDLGLAYYFGSKK